MYKWLLMHMSFFKIVNLIKKKNKIKVIYIILEQNFYEVAEA